MKKILMAFVLSLLTVACSSTQKYRIDNSTYVATARNERVRFIVIHYTAVGNEVSLRALLGKNVSSHYLILDDDSDVIYNLVPEEKRAWHAGVSEFGGRSNLNDTSIGIEIVNEGIKKEYRNKTLFPPYEYYVEYKPEQIKKLVQLLEEISQRYQIAPKNILAHSDIAPTRKKDPGAKFPWKYLAKHYNLGAWYEEEDKQLFMKEEEYQKLSVKELKEELRKYGYAVNNTDIWDKESKQVVYAFQLHFVPENLTGEMDLETYAILKALNKKYSK